jgi:type I restriction enzyme R subunit
MEALLDRYADQGLETLESPDVLKVIPFPQIGTPVELIHAFGSRNKYVAALRDLEAQLYKTA